MYLPLHCSEWIWKHKKGQNLGQIDTSKQELSLSLSEEEEEEEEEEAFKANDFSL